MGLDGWSLMCVSGGPWAARDLDGLALDVADGLARRGGARGLVDVEHVVEVRGGGRNLGGGALLYSCTVFFSELLYSVEF